MKPGHANRARAAEGAGQPAGDKTRREGRCLQVCSGGKRSEVESTTSSKKAKTVSRPDLENGGWKSRVSYCVFRLPMCVQTPARCL